jgi:ABC-type dipeptide/oligopeptide/nickel transport system ATPase component
MRDHKTLEMDEYLDQEVPKYHANPFIEALPAIVDKKEFFRRMTCLPPYDSKLRSSPDHIRAHLISDGFDFFLPLPRHHSLQTCIDRMQRRGYLARNPIPQESYWKLVQNRIRSVTNDLDSKKNFTQSVFRSTAAAASDLTSALTGVSGGGKSLALRMILTHIPQVREHGIYHGVRLNIRQVTWLWIEASHKGSPNDVCRSFFRALDEILGTNYEDFFGKGTLTVMMAHVTRLAAVHAIGLLVIDEIQELSNIKSGGDKALVGFFLKLTNTIKIPVLMVGTYKAQAMLNQQMRHIRRSTGIGIPSWEPLSRSLKEWDTFIQVLWRYQYTRTPTQLSDPLSDALFEECQGIPDFAVKLYFLCQDRLIATNEGRDKEIITPRTIRTVASEYLSPARDLLQALRYKDKEKLEHLDDVKLPTLEELTEQRKRRYELVVGLGYGSGAEQSDQEPSAQSASQDPNQSASLHLAKQLNSQAPPSAEKKRSLIATVVGKNTKNPNDAYQALADAGLIKSTAEFC